MSNLEMMLSACGLTHLPGHVELALVKPLLFLNALVVEAQASLDQMIQRSKESAHHPFGQRRIETLKLCNADLSSGEI